MLKLLSSYPSDISREQFSKIEPILLAARKITAPRRVDLYDAFCAVLHVLKTGCQWRFLPHDYPKWNNVYSYFRIWSERIDNQPSIVEQILKKELLTFGLQMKEKKRLLFVL